MQHDEFIGQVQNRAHLSSRGDAERAPKATQGGLFAELEESLPADIRELVTAGASG